LFLNAFATRKRATGERDLAEGVGVTRTLVSDHPSDAARANNQNPAHEKSPRSLITTIALPTRCDFDVRRLQAQVT
jgi:hypothetical protein